MIQRKIILNKILNSVRKIVKYIEVTYQISFKIKET